MIVDIGGGTTDIAVISLSGIVESTSIKIAGDQFDEAIVKYIRRKHNVLIGERTAEELKMQIGCVFPRPEEQTVEIKGRCLMTGLPRVFSVSSSEMIEPSRRSPPASWRPSTACWSARLPSWWPISPPTASA